jgi:hypothetical protein
MQSNRKDWPGCTEESSRFRQRFVFAQPSVCLTNAKVAVDAYRGRPFGDARGRGDSYVPHSWFKTSRKSRPDILPACIHHGIVTVVKENEELRVYCKGLSVFLRDRMPR